MQSRPENSSRTATLLAAAHSTDPEVRNQAAMAIGTERPAGVIDEIVRLLTDEDSVPVVETLTWAVVNYRPESTAALVRGLEAAPTDEARVRLLHALSKTGDASALPAVLAHVDSPDDAVAARAWWALARLGGDPDVLVAHLGQAHPEQSAALVRALVEYGPDAVDGLIDALADERSAVVTQAAEALVRMIDPMTRGTRARALVSDQVARAREALVEAPAPEVVDLLRLLSVDERPGIAESAQQILAERASR